MLQSFVIYGGLIMIMFFLNIKNAYVQNYDEFDISYKSSFLQPGLILSLLAFAIICGLRYMVGVDYVTYWHIYMGMKAHPYNDTYPGLELGFYWLLKSLAAIQASHQWMFGILAFIQVFFIYYAFKKQRFLYPLLAFVIISGGFYFLMMNAIRQSLAWCILFAAIPYANKKGIIKYLILTIIAFLFHKSAIIFIPIFFIAYSEKDFFKSLKLQYGLLFGAMLLAETPFLMNLNEQMLFLIDLVGYGDKYGNLDEILSEFQGNFSKGARYFGPFLIYIIVIFYSTEMKLFYATKIFIKYYNLFFIGALSFFLTYQNMILQRPAQYLIVMQIPLVAYLLFYLWKKTNKKPFDILLLWGTIMVQMLILFAYVKSNFYTQYLFYWEKLVFLKPY